MMEAPTEERERDMAVPLCMLHVEDSPLDTEPLNEKATSCVRCGAVRFPDAESRITVCHHA